MRRVPGLMETENVLVNGVAAEDAGVGSTGAAAGGLPLEPVFVLCMGRSGSTLLRFLLDAHPELACPPETSLPALCTRLAVVWSLIEGAPLAAERGDAPPQVPDAAVKGIRRMLDEMTGSYLDRRGKRLFCDKSLGSAMHAGLLRQIYPRARFVCLYRHPMDMIRSGLEACPFGLNGYGFDPYIAESPGNAVLALARYWLDNAAAIAAVEEAHPDQCHRVRYEDLVEDPESAIQEVYAFLGVAPAPGVARTAFSGERERFGPADHKIWATSSVSGNSVGRGESVPAGLIPPPITGAINELAAKLGYRPVDAEWGTPGQSSDPRDPATVSGSPASPDVLPAVPVPGAEALEQWLRSRAAGAAEQVARRWESCAADRFVVVSRTVTGGSEAQWVVDIASRTIVPDDGQDEDVAWSLLASPETWQAVRDGRDNLLSAMRRSDMRYCSADEDNPVLTQTRVAMLGDLLGLSSWSAADTVPEAAAAVVMVAS
jgi:protein-tyrosine sulfotransferase